MAVLVIGAVYFIRRQARKDKEAEDGRSKNN